MAADDRDARIEKLERQVAELLQIVGELRNENVELRRENAALREENVALRKEIEEWRRGFRERRKRRTSKAEGRSRATGKPRGRRPGHAPAQRPVPKHIDKTIAYGLRGRCDCGGHVDPTGEFDSTIVQDIPPVQVQNTRHLAPVGRCRKCNKRIVERLPGAVESGRSIAAVQLGPRVQALALDLRFARHVPLNGIASVLGTWFGVTITPGGLSQMFDRLRGWSEPSYREIEAHVRNSAVVGLDETGLRQDGVGGWTWIARTDSASLFRVELSRASWVAEQMLGDGFVGVVCTDFYGVYTRRDDWTHGYCGAHTQREARKIAEVTPNAITVSFSDRLDIWYLDAKRVQASGGPAAQHLIRRRLQRLIADPALAQNTDVARLQHRLDEHFDGVMTFVYRPDVPADNNASERDLRAFAVHRRVTGGTRSAQGSLTLGHWMSVTQTLRKNQLPLPDWVAELHAARLRGRPPPSVFS